MEQLSSCDSIGSIFFTEDLVFRGVNPVDFEEVMRACSLLQARMAELGIVETAVYSGAAPNDQLRGKKLLKHDRVEFISYPNEWCGETLKDAALFHLGLASKLNEIGLHLKDAHPWNILIQRGEMIFVDFTSIVTTKLLYRERYLEANTHFSASDSDERMAHLIHEIYQRTFLPFFIRPLLAYTYGRRELIRPEIERTTLNTSVKEFSNGLTWPAHPFTPKRLFAITRLVCARLRLKRIFRRLLRDNDVPAFFCDLKGFISALDVRTDRSSYTDYYQAKGEALPWNDQTGWNDKQKSVHKALETPYVRSVLDVACNTGWFSLLAASMGKEVVAFDIDESCVEKLYLAVKESRAEVLPLVCSFTNLTLERRSKFDDLRVLIPAEERLKCDAVLALAIIHHLVLGVGLSVDTVVDKLASLTRKRLVLEFVSLEDPLIVKEPEFFPALNRDSKIREGYDLDGLKKSLGRHFHKVEILASSQASRLILVCDKA
jgi:SAM-dependent methyltransferase